MTFQPRVRFGWLLAALVVVGAVGASAARLAACPFCSAVSLTFSEEINNSQVAVIAKLVQAPPPVDDASIDVAKARFEVLDVLKGADALGKTREIEVVYFGDSPLGTKFLVMGIDPPNISWGTPIATNDRAIEYVKRAMELPNEGADRLAYFQDFLEDQDEMLARDAYDEFAKAPYGDVLALAPRMHHDKLIEWIKSSEVAVSRRRLYLTMLGACGKPADVAVLEEMIKSSDRQTKGALDALVASYLTLKGAEGMPLVEELFLKNQNAEYPDTYAAIMALRFHGTEEDVIPRARLLEGLRLMLDRPKLADLVIPDLARWEDWSVVDRLSDLFKNSDEESSWVRVPVINYLRACPRPEAKTRLEELAKIDPESIKRADSFSPLGLVSGAAGKDKDSKDKDDDKEATAGKPTEKNSAEKSDAAKSDAEAKPAAGAATGSGTSEQKTADPGRSSSVPRPGAERVELTRPRETAILAGHLSRGAALEPGPPAKTLPALAALAAAAVVLAGAFWLILKGGQRVAD